MDVSFDIDFTELEEAFDIDFTELEETFDIEFDSEVIPISTNDYNYLLNKPSINSVTLIENKTSSDLGLQDAMDYITNTELAILLT